MYTAKEIASIKKFCNEIGEIIIPENLDLVEETATTELKKFFEGYELSGSKKLLIGRSCNSEEIAKLFETGALKVADVSVEDDGFEIKTTENEIVIAGANPRGVLYGVFALEDWILEGAEGTPDCYIVPQFRKRSSAPGHYHNSRTVNFVTDVIDEKKVAYLARLRVNQYCGSLGTFVPSCLEQLVHSDVFPFQKEPDPSTVKKFKELSYLLARYGIECYVMSWVPGTPETFAPKEMYPPEALGQVRCPWDGNLITTLCISSPLGQKYFKNIVQKFIKEYPYVRGFFFYNMESHSWICTPSLCPQCAANLVDSDPDIHNPWETQALLVTLLTESAHEIDPTFKINFWGVHFRDDAMNKLFEAAKGYNALTCGASGCDHDAYIANTDEPCKYVEDTLKAAKRHGVPTYCYYTYNKLEAIQVGFPNPLIVAESIQTLKRWGFDNLMEITGPTAVINQVNAIAMKQFQSAPDTDAKEWLTWLGKRQFGEKAAQKAVEVWTHTRNAYHSWEGTEMHPLRGSQFVHRMALLSNVPPILRQPLILPEFLTWFESYLYNVLIGNEPWSADAYQIYLSQECADRYAAMEVELEKAVLAAKELVELASDEDRIGISYYEGTFEGIERYTMKEYAKVNLVPIEIAYRMCGQKKRLTQAIRLLREMRDGDPKKKPALQKEYLILMHAEMESQKEFGEYLYKISRERPCFAMTGMLEREILDYKNTADENAEAIRKYLAENE